jgi:WhiB family redox-sensing transcriptional regulator
VRTLHDTVSNEPVAIPDVWPRPVWDRAKWRDLAACQDVDSSVFFPVGTTGAALVRINNAKAICATCPVQEECLTFAVATNQEFGVWGGCDEDERRRIRRRWRSSLRRAQTTV